MQLRPTVLLAIPNRSAFLHAYYERDASAGVWVPGNNDFNLGTQVDIEIAFAEEQLVLHSRGVVRSKRLHDHANLRAGIGVEFLASENKTRELILAFAKGEKELARRKSRRLPIVIDVEVTLLKGNKHNCTTENICREGVLVANIGPLPIDSVVKLALKPPGYKNPLFIDAKVRWNRDDDKPAVGFNFLFTTPSSISEIGELLGLLRSRLAK
ncbi:MAG: PilZ domain-containing protein [Deltaproteobacteria bacterium]|nr:PilZ domain-containing protein [Deltaproteobacteria bacterium]